MQSPSITCPECGAPIARRNPWILVAQCEYCSSVIYWNRDGIEHSGKKSVLMEGFTRLYRGACGSLREHRFEVLGRLRYSFGGGLWDEWYITFDNESGAWITEDDHQLAIQTPLTAPFDPTPAAYQPGHWCTIDGITYMIHEVGEAECVGVEGMLPQRISPGETYRYADGSSPDGRFALGIEFDRSPPTAFRGDWLHHHELRLDDEAPTS